MKPECPYGAQVTDFAAGELTDAARREIESHLRECGDCAEALAAYRRFIASLRSLPMPEASPILTPQVLAAIREQPRKSAVMNFIPLGLAAAVTLIAFLPFIRRTPAPVETAAVPNVAEAPASSLDRAIQWLCANQDADGSWDAEKWGGNRDFEVALTAMPTIAIISGNSTTPERAAVYSRAVAWLRARQSGDGTFGPQNVGMPYNHSIATLALLHAYRMDRDPRLKLQIDSAVAAMVQAQIHDGGWAWKGALSSDRIITGWHIEALRLADELGIENSRTALDRSLTWVAARSKTGSTHVSPSMIPALKDAPTDNGELDLCRAYFLTINLQRDRDEVSKRQLAEIRRNLIQHQVPAGEDSGSWLPDRRGRGGGRVYATALASLSLKDL